MRPKLENRIALAFIPLLLSSFAACATDMQMTAEELQDLGPDEGLVLGSFRVEGGDDILGRTRWKLLVEKAGQGWRLAPSAEFAVEAKRDGGEVVFITKMTAGDYHFYKLVQPGFSSAEAEIDIPFRVPRGKTVYVGRVVIQFPPGNIMSFTKMLVSIESDQASAMKRVEEEHGITLSDVVTDLMRLNGTRAP